MTDAYDFAQLMRLNAERFGDSVAISSAEGKWTYPEIDRNAERIAGALQEMGVAPGDRIALVMGNRAEWVLTAFGAAYAGATVVAVNTWYSRAEITRAIEHSQCRVVIVQDRFLKHRYLEDVLVSIQDGDLADVRHVVALSDDGNGSLPSAPRDALEFHAWSDLVAADPLSRVSARPERIIYLLYTSGTTGPPKGVLLRQDGVVRNGVQIADAFGLDHSDRGLLCAPLCFGFGCMQVLFSLMAAGARVVIQDRFDPPESVALIEYEQCTAFFGFGHMSRALYEAAGDDRHRLRSLRKGRGGMAVGDMRFAADHLNMTDVSLAYGMTELYGPCTAAPVSDPLDVRLEGWMAPLPNVDVKIVDPETGARLEPLVEGEIRVRREPPAVGYWVGDGVSTDSFDDDGFFRTGDLGIVRSDGRMKYVGRIKEMIKTAGMNVAPAEIEAVLAIHVNVDEVCVVGVPDDRLTEVPIAVVRRAGEIDEAELSAWCRQRLTGYKVPARIIVVDHALPKLGTEKLDRRAVTELVELDRRASG